MSANLRAFLALIRWCEGTSGPDGYRTMVGGKLFENFADHPRQMFSGTFANGTRWRSTAAGAYQFISASWDEARAALGLPDFSPKSQDEAAVWLIRRAGALADVEAGNLVSALKKCSPTWASLPFAPYGQPTKTLADCQRIYLAVGGSLMQAAGVTPPSLPEAAAATPAPQPAAPPAPEFQFPGLEGGLPPEPPPAPKTTAKDAAMPLPIPAIIALGAELLKILPWGEKRAGRIEEAAPLLIEIAKAVVPVAANEQEAVEQVMSNAKLRDQFVAAAALKWSDLAPLLEFEEKSRREARDYTERMTGTGPAWRQIGAGALLAVLSLVIVGGTGYVFYEVLFADASRFSASTRDGIVEVLKNILILVVGFFFGSSVSGRASGQTVSEIAKQK